MEIKTDSIAFGPAKDTGGPLTGTKDVTFPSTVARAFAVLTGTTFGFSPHGDRDFGSVNIKVDAEPLGATVRVTATLGVRDWSGDWDDKYEGDIHFAVLADLT